MKKRLLSVCLLVSCFVTIVSAQNIAYIHGDVSEAGAIPSGVAEPYDQMLIADTGDLGCSEFGQLVEASGYTIADYYDEAVTLNAAFLNQFDAIVFGLHQKIWSDAERSALDTWLRAGGGALFYSDSAAGGIFSIVGAANSVGQTAVNNVISAYGMEVTLDQAGGVRSFLATSSHPVVDGPLIFEGEGVSPVVVDNRDPLVEVLIAYDASNLVAGRDPALVRLRGVNIPESERTFAALARRSVGAGNLVVSFDRQPMWNNGPGSNIQRRDNREILRRIVEHIAGGPADTNTNEPIRVEAEDFDEGANGTAYFDTTAGNDGGQFRATDVDVEITGDVDGDFNVGHVAPGEWLEYTMDFANAGVYDITLRVASNLTTDRSFHLEIDGVDVTGIVTFNTGGAGWQTYQDVVVENVAFDAGAQTLRVEMDSGSFNFNYFELVEVSSAQIPNPSTLVPLSRDNWVVTASVSSFRDPATNAIDGDDSTRWATGQRQTLGQIFNIDLGESQNFSSVVLETEGNPDDFARGYIISVSTDGSDFTTVATGAGVGAVEEIVFAEQTARYIRIQQTGSVRNWWSIHELNVLASDSDLGLVHDAGAFDAESNPSNANTIRPLGTAVGFIRNGSWVAYNDFNFGSGASNVDISAATGRVGGVIELRLDSPTGTLIGSVEVTNTGGFDEFLTFSGAIANSATGVHDLYLVFTGGNGFLFDVESFKID